ncbi:flagellar assembly protein FliH [Gammaproteobacteria bacterium]
MVVATSSSRVRILSAELTGDLETWILPQVRAGPYGYLARQTDEEYADSLEAGTVEEMPEPEPGPPPRPPTAEEIEAIERQAREEGFREGHREGLQAGQAEAEEAARLKAEETRREVDAARNEADRLLAEQRAKQDATLAEQMARQDATLAERVALLDAILGVLEKPLTRLDRQVEEELLALVAATVRQVIRREIRQDPQLILPIVREALGVLPVSSRQARLHLHPEDVPIVRAAYSVAGQPLPWTIVEEPALDRGGCRVDTQISHIDASLESRLEPVLARLLAVDPPQDPQDPQDADDESLTAAP